MAVIFDNGFYTSARQLYPFSSFTFTTAGVSGSFGPSGSVLLASYTGSSSGSYFSNPQYFTTSSFRGYQIWTVPKTGTYQIEAGGSRSGMGTGAIAAPTSVLTGSGAIIKANLFLSQGDKLMMVVGQYADSTGSQQTSYTTYLGYGGGGGSYVVLSGSSLTPLLVAGGGGGAGHYFSYNSGRYYSGSNGVTTPNGGASVQGAPGGTGSMGGRSHINTGSTVSLNAYDGGGGGGFLGYGYNGAGLINSQSVNSSQGSGGWSFISGSVGGMTGTTYTNYAGTAGGFGGGGGGNGIIAGGGGGGYSGGGGTYAAGNPASDAGGGGGSYIISTATNVATSNGNYDNLSTFSGSAITNLAKYNSGSGYIKITLIG